MGSSNIYNELIILFVISIFTLLFLWYIYRNKDMVYVLSQTDNKYYLVRDVSDKQNAANILGQISNNIKTLSEYLYKIKNNETYVEYIKYIDILHNKYKNIVYVESSQDSIYTSYSVNKGEQIVFCLRSKRSNNEIHNLNLIMYVVLHEISHVACPVYDNHGPLFQKIFGFLTKQAIELGLYSKIDFVKNPVEYCGLNINKSII